MLNLLKTTLGVLSVAILLSSCGKELTDLSDATSGLSEISGFLPTDLRNDPELTPYINEFVSLAGAYGKSGISASQVYLQFGNTAPQGVSVIGVCERSSRYRRVTINATFFNAPTTDEDTRKSLIFHELGHCLNNRKHRIDQYLGNPVIAGLELGWPLSIMNPTIVKSARYAPDATLVPAFDHLNNNDAYTHYLDELFDSNYMGDWAYGSGASSNAETESSDLNHDENNTHNNTGCAVFIDPITGAPIAQNAPELDTLGTP
jgi:hypothetical protein